MTEEISNMGRCTWESERQGRCVLREGTHLKHRGEFSAYGRARPWTGLKAYKDREHLQSIDQNPSQAFTVTYDMHEEQFSIQKQCGAEDPVSHLHCTLRRGHVSMHRNLSSGDAVYWGHNKIYKEFRSLDGHFARCMHVDMFGYQCRLTYGHERFTERKKHDYSTRPSDAARIE